MCKTVGGFVNYWLRAVKQIVDQPRMGKYDAAVLRLAAGKGGG